MIGGTGNSRSRDTWHVGGNVTHIGGGGAVVGGVVILAAVVAAVVALASAAAAIVGVGAVLGLSAAAVHVADQTATGVARRRREALEHRRRVELAEASRTVVVVRSMSELGAGPVCDLIPADGMIVDA